MNEQTIDAIMKAAAYLAQAEVQHQNMPSSLRAGVCARKGAALRHAIAAALAAKDAEIDALARWKSTNAHRVDALAGLLATVRANEAKGAEAISSLESERAANALLTAEIERLTAQLAEPAKPEPAKPEPGEWIEWKGGPPPINDGVRFQVKFRDGSQGKGYDWTNARDWIWADRGYFGDIVAYRVLP